ncbi:hypothetical protein [Magnetospirillum fulvum]|jgi:hypothetical protein|uniref:Uncharacterized protein n=1 Tax=Magnetospirillum fulvum MGU-K5 TaxID=1316936 RepID=S9SES1_MAGFU|nr:hypothetical protein [Magnetospirillum fulvum]EPY03229.1 hypothetical protein K678_01261 [Magnetospirillum fulvum MGU-K5]
MKRPRPILDTVLDGTAAIPPDCGTPCAPRNLTRPPPIADQIAAMQAATPPPKRRPSKKSRVLARRRAIWLALQARLQAMERMAINRGLITVGDVYEKLINEIENIIARDASTPRNRNLGKVGIPGVDPVADEICDLLTEGKRVVIDLIEMIPEQFHRHHPARYTAAESEGLASVGMLFMWAADPREHRADPAELVAWMFDVPVSPEIGHREEAA